MRTFDHRFLLLLGLLALGRFALTSNVALSTIYAPHDDWLYVVRAYHLLLDGTLGVYDARTLVKLPAFSFFLAANRLLGIPYLLFSFILYAAAGIYLTAAFRRVGVGCGALLAVYLLYLFNPVTFDAGWYRVLREPLASSLLTTMLGAMAFVLQHQKEGRTSWLHIGVLAVVFAFAVQLREDDVLLYAPITAFALIAAWEHRLRHGRWHAAKIGPLAFLLLLPFLFAKIGDIAVRQYVERHYGLPILHELAEGEYPRLIAAIRGIDSKKDNRYVMITQEALQKLRHTVPVLAPVIARLPPPFPASESCTRFRVCSEWTNGYMPFWLKEVIGAELGEARLPEIQRYLRDLATSIRTACHDGRLQCREHGSGLLPTFEVRWSRAALLELAYAVGQVVSPRVQLATTNQANSESLRLDQAAIYRFVTMAPPSNNVVDFGRFENAASLLTAGKAFTLFAMAGGLVCLALRRVRLHDSTISHLVLIVLILAAVRVTGMAYVSVYMGSADARIYFASHVALAVVLSTVFFASLSFSASSRRKIP